jgi:hypothetical protein
MNEKHLPYDDKKWREKHPQQKVQGIYKGGV